jgi:hypothetical protein
MSVGEVFRREPTQLSRRVGAAWLVTTPNDSHLHELRGGAAIVWEKLATFSTVDELVAATGDSKEAEELREVIRDLVDALCGLGVVRACRT